MDQQFRNAEDMPSSEANEDDAKLSSKSDELWNIYRNTVKDNLRSLGSRMPADVSTETNRLIEDHLSLWKSCLETYQVRTKKAEDALEIECRTSSSLKSQLSTLRERLLAYDKTLHEYSEKGQVNDEDLGKNSVLLSSMLRRSATLEETIRQTERQLAKFKERAQSAESQLFQKSTELSKLSIELDFAKNEPRDPIDNRELHLEIMELKQQVSLEKDHLSYEMVQKSDLEEELRETKKKVEMAAQELARVTEDYDRELEKLQHEHSEKQMNWMENLVSLNREQWQERTDLLTANKAIQQGKDDNRKLEQSIADLRQQLVMIKMRYSRAESLNLWLVKQMEQVQRELVEQDEFDDVYQQDNDFSGNDSQSDAASRRRKNGALDLVRQALETADTKLSSNRLDDDEEKASDDGLEESDNGSVLKHQGDTKPGISQHAIKAPEAIEMIREGCSILTRFYYSELSIQVKVKELVDMIKDLEESAGQRGSSASSLNEEDYEDKSQDNGKSTTFTGALAALLKVRDASGMVAKSMGIEPVETSLAAPTSQEDLVDELPDEDDRAPTKANLPTLNELAVTIPDSSENFPESKIPETKAPDREEDPLSKRNEDPNIKKKADIYEHMIKTLNDQLQETKGHCDKIRNILTTALREMGSTNLSQADRNLQKIISKQIVRESESILEVLNDVMRELDGASRFVHPDQHRVAELLLKCEELEKQKVLIVAPNNGGDVSKDPESILHAKNFAEVLVELDGKIDSSKAFAAYITDVLSSALDKVQGLSFPSGKGIANSANSVVEDIKNNIDEILKVQEEVRDILAASEKFIHPDHRLARENKELKAKLEEKIKSETRLTGELRAAQEVLQLRDESTEESYKQVHARSRSVFDQPPLEMDNIPFLLDQKKSSFEPVDENKVPPADNDEVSLEERVMQETQRAKTFTLLVRDLQSRIKTAEQHCDVAREVLGSILTEVGADRLSEEERDLKQGVADTINNTIENVVSVLEEIAEDIEQAKRYIHPDHRTVNELELRYQKFKGDMAVLESENKRLNKKIWVLKAKVDKSRQDYSRTRRTLSRGGSLIGSDFTALFAAAPVRDDGALPTGRETSFNEVAQVISQELQRGKNQFGVIKLLTDRVFSNVQQSAGYGMAPRTQLIQNQMNTCCDNASKALVAVEKGLATAYSFVHPDQGLISQLKKNLEKTERKLKITYVEKDRLKVVFTAAQQLLREKDTEIEHFKQVLMEETEEDADIFGEPVEMTPTQPQTFDEVAEKLRNFLANAMDSCAHTKLLEGSNNVQDIREGLSSMNTNLKNARLVLSHLGAFAHPDHKRVSNLKRLCINLKKRYQSTLIAMEKFKSTFSVAERKPEEKGNVLMAMNLQPPQQGGDSTHRRKPSARRIKQQGTSQPGTPWPAGQEEPTLQEIKQDVQEMTSVVDKAKQHCCIIKDVFVNALRDVGMQELSQAEKDLQNNIGDQIEKFAQNIMDTLTEVGEEFMFLEEHISAQNSLVKKFSSRFRATGQRHEEPPKLADTNLNGACIDMSREEYNAVSQELQNVVRDAMKNCSVIRESAKDALAVSQKRKIVQNDGDYVQKATDIILHNVVEVQDSLSEVREELNLAGRLMVENDAVIQERSKMFKKRIQELKKIIRNYQKKSAENEMERINVEKELLKTKALLSRRASQLLHLEQAIRLEQDKNSALQVSAARQSDGGNTSDDVRVDREVLLFRERLLTMEQQLELSRMRAKMVEADHKAEVQQLTNIHTTKEHALNEEYIDRLESLKREASETEVRLKKVQASYSKAQDMVKAKKLEIKKRDETISKNTEKIELMRSLLLNNSIAFAMGGEDDMAARVKMMETTGQPIPTSGNEQRSDTGDQVLKSSFLLDGDKSFTAGITNLMATLSSMLSIEKFDSIQELVERLSKSHKAELSEIKMEMNAPASELEKLKLEVEQVSTANKYLNAELEKAEEDLNALREKQAMEAPNYKLLQSQLTETQQQLEESQNRYEKSSNLLEETKNKLQQSTVQFQEAQAHLDKSTLQLKEFESQRLELQSKLREADTSLQVKINEMQQLTEELETSKKSFSDLMESKLQFITQSSIEIERLKKVIRNYSDPIIGDGSQLDRDPTAVLAFSGWV